MGKLIVIEGGDGAGKGTQAERALEALRARGAQVEMFDFPQYKGSLPGALIGRALNGELGDFRSLNPYFAALPYTLDRVTARKDLHHAMFYETDYALCNRYTPSNLYQAAKFEKEEEQDAFIAWLEALEYGELQLPKPSLVIYLHVPYDIGQKLVQQKAARAHVSGGQGALDQHERDTAFVKDVIKLYHRTAGSRADWKIVECVRDGTMRSIDDIHQEVMGLISSL